MKKLLLKYLSILLILLFSINMYSQNNTLKVKDGVIDISGWNFEHDGNISLEGDWAFYWEKLLTPNSADSIPDAFMTVPGAWTGNLIGNETTRDTGFVSYRLKIISDKDYQIGIMIYFREILTAYRVFFNGELISSIGMVGTNSSEAVPRVRINKESILIHKGENELIVQVSNYSHRTNGFASAPIIGEEDNVDRVILKSIGFDFIILGLLLIMAFYHFGLFLFRTKNKVALFFALFSLILAIRVVVSNNFLLPYIIPEMKWKTVYLLSYLSFYLGIPLFIVYFKNIFEETRFKWLFNIVYIVSLLFAFTLFLPSIVYTKLLIFYQAFVLIIILVLLIFLINYVFKRKLGSVILFVSIIIIAGTVVNDILYYNDVINTIILIPFGLFVMVLGQALTLGRIFTSAFIQNENLSETLEFQNKNLENLVRERTEQLEKEKLNLNEKNEELLVAEEELRQNNEELTLLSDNLEVKNEELNKISIKLRSQVTIGDILKNTTVSSLNLKDFLKQTLDIVLEIPWLKLVSKGSIFVTNAEGNLEMIVEKDLGILTQKCAIIKPGQCLCGLALAQKKIVFRNKITHEHTIESDDMQPHGHYNIPLILNEKVLGVLNLYVSDSHKSSEFEIEYLETLGSIIASVINRYYLHKNLEKQREILSEQNIQLEKFNIDLKKYYIAFEQTPVSIVITDKESNIEYINPAFTKTTGYSLDEVIGKNPRILNSGKTSVETYKSLWKNLHLGKVWTGEFINKSKSGDEFIEKASISPVFDDNGNLLNYLAVKEDITDLREKEIEIQNKNLKLEELNKELQKSLRSILDSINYARRIQQALLPSKYVLKYILNDYFLIYKPKETVSGDFYFVQEKEQYKMFAVGDCTGHGVPGGFLTMLSISFLKELTSDFNLTNPAELLEKFRSKIKAILNVNESITNDGLDIAFCIFDTKNRTLYYSGANMPIFIVRNKQLMEFKAVKNPIGNYPLERKFVSHKIDIKDGDFLYISSDGYWDQFSKSNSKYTINRFKKLLIEISDSDITQQENIFIKELDNWKKDYFQVDDIALLGINLSEL